MMDYPLAPIYKPPRKGIVAYMFGRKKTKNPEVYYFDKLICFILTLLVATVIIME